MELLAVGEDKSVEVRFTREEAHLLLMMMTYPGGKSWTKEHMANRKGMSLLLPYLVEKALYTENNIEVQNEDLEGYARQIGYLVNRK